MTIDYPAKGSIPRVVTLPDPATYELIRELHIRRSGGAAALATPPTGKPPSRTGSQKRIRLAVKEVLYLGNTPTVCRRSYIDPKVLDRFEHGDTVAAAPSESGEESDLSDPARD